MSDKSTDPHMPATHMPAAHMPAAQTPAFLPAETAAPVTAQWLKDIRSELRTCLDDLQAEAALTPGQLLVVGASSSEIAGHRIGTHTSLAIGRAVAEAVMAFADETGIDIAFQCCEHLNRALVVPRTLANQRGWQEVSVIPVPGAGGSVAAHAYALLPNPCVVERLEADAGIDIGDTLMGMHLRRVAVPVRGRRTTVGSAHVTMARTRPPLIGGARAVYDVMEAKRRLFDGIEERGDRT